MRMPSSRVRSLGSGAPSARAGRCGVNVQESVTRIRELIVIRLYFMNRSQMGNRHLYGGMRRLYGGGERQGLLFLPVYDEYPIGQGINRVEVGEEIAAVRMCRETIEFDDLGAAFGRNPKDGYNVPSFNQFSSQRMFGLKADKHDNVGFVFDGMFEMVHD